MYEMSFKQGKFRVSFTDSCPTNSIVQCIQERLMLYQVEGRTDTIM